MATYKLKPFRIKAVQWDGDNLMNIECLVRNISLADFIKYLLYNKTEYSRWLEHERIVADKGLYIPASNKKTR